jgi:hypothetical protein
MGDNVLGGLINKGSNYDSQNVISQLKSLLSDEGPRNEKIIVLVTSETKEKLKHLSKKYNLSVSEMANQALKNYILDHNKEF